MAKKKARKKPAKKKPAKKAAKKKASGKKKTTTKASPRGSRLKKPDVVDEIIAKSAKGKVERKCDDGAIITVEKKGIEYHVEMTAPSGYVCSYKLKKKNMRMALEAIAADRGGLVD